MRNLGSLSKFVKIDHYSNLTPRSDIIIYHKLRQITDIV